MGDVPHSAAGPLIDCIGSLQPDRHNLGLANQWPRHDMRLQAFCFS